ncbi:MAG: cupredoxin domain-containing protein [Cypionkella sp.]
MTCQRRQVLVWGGGLLVALAAPALAGSVEVIEMRGSARGEKVWFMPQGLLVEPGTTLRFINHDPGNSHTSTAYDPAILDRQRRIPEGAEAWNSDFLMPGQSFDVTLTLPGVYDFYCQPHEHAGMVGRIVVGPPTLPGWQGPAPDSDDLPPEALAAFPKVADIVARTRVFAKEAT